MPEQKIRNFDSWVLGRPLSERYFSPSHFLDMFKKYYYFLTVYATKRGVREVFTETIICLSYRMP